MCGIAGIIDPKRATSADDLTTLVGKMNDRLTHRGPDSSGRWVDATAGIALGQRRLAIIDLSDDGHQPMTSASGRYVIVFNGEIYNFRSLRQELEGDGVAFRGHSDTEVMLALIERDGLDASLDRLAGMFAIALWDKRDARLHLVRDRLGKKPLYLGWAGGSLLFGSELKAIASHPDFASTIDRQALSLFFRHKFIPAPLTIWEDVLKLPAGCRLTLDTEDAYLTPGQDLTGAIQPYWSMLDVAENGMANPADLDDQEALDHLEKLLGLATTERMISDVPLGAFLSGGIDSSLIVAMMQRHANQPVKTFTVGFDQEGYDETEKAAAVARHLGTEHHEFQVTADEARSVIPDLADLFDEPFADSSQIPMFHVARMARTEVTVCVSGDGGDELFGGYRRYGVAKRLETLRRCLPGVMRQPLASLLRRTPVSCLDRIVGLMPVRGDDGGFALSGDRLQKLGDILGARDGDDLYWQVLHPAADLDRAIRWPKGDINGRASLQSFVGAPSFTDYTHRMMYFDAASYLPEDILVKVDRASMAVSLETRAPLLDHRVVDFVWRLPLAQKVRDGESKWLMRRLLERHVPAEIIDQTKKGFTLPVAEWLRGPLHDWAEALLSPSALDSHGLIDPEPVRRRWREHQEGRRNWSSDLWSVLMFQAWSERWTQS